MEPRVGDRYRGSARRQQCSHARRDERPHGDRHARKATPDHEGAIAEADRGAATVLHATPTSALSVAPTAIAAITPANPSVPSTDRSRSPALMQNSTAHATMPMGATSTAMPARLRAVPNPGTSSQAAPNADAAAADRSNASTMPCSSTPVAAFPARRRATARVWRRDPPSHTSSDAQRVADASCGATTGRGEKPRLHGLRP